jgi:hypothetical protein
MRLIPLGLLIALGWTAYYLSSCVFWPYTSCGRCKGTARHTAWWGGGFRQCGRCDGTGRRLRIGRRVWNRIHSLRKDAS